MLEYNADMFKRQMMYNEDLTLHIDVRHRCLLQDAMKEAKKKKFDAKKCLQVNCQQARLS